MLINWRLSVVHLWRQRTSRQDDYHRTKSNNETRVQNPQSCAWLVVRQNQFRTKDPNQVCWHQKPTRWHADQREFHTWGVESSSSLVQTYEFLDVLLQPFQQFSFWSDPKAERHLTVRARSDFQWRFIDGETKVNDSGDGETHESGVAQPVLSARKNPPQDLRDPVNPGNVDANPSQDPIEYSQVRRQENTQHADSLKQGDRDESSNSTSSWKLVRAVNTKTDFQNMKITNHQYLTKGFSICAKEFGNHNLLNICNGSNKDQCIDVGIVHVFINESSHSSWTRLFTEFGSFQEHELRGNSEFIQYHTETHIGTLWRDSECQHDWKYISVHLPHRRDLHRLMIKWSSGQRQKVRVFSDSVLCLGEVVMIRSKRCNDKMGRSSGRIQNVRFLLRIAGNRWRSNWFRVKYFPRIYVIADSSEDPGWFARTEHWTWNIHQNFRHCRFFRKSRMTWENETLNLKIHRTDHLHVNV